MGRIIQLTGLSGAGKTTLSDAIAHWAIQQGLKIKLVDGDVYRQSLCKDLGFSREDRLENICRLGAYAHANSADYDFIFIAAINPFEEGRNRLKINYKALLIWLRCELKTLIERDTKGLYRKAGLPDNHPEKIHNLTGFNDPFEEPLTADLIVDTDKLSLEGAVDLVIRFLKSVTSSA